MLLLKAYWKQILVAFIVGVVLAFIYHQGYDKADSRWQARWDRQQLDIAAAKLKAEQAEREKEQRWQQQLDKVTQDAQIQKQILQRDLADANTAASSLREQAKKLATSASKARNNTGVARGSEATGAACMVLADVLERIDQRAGELAEYADRSRAAGLNCQASYEVVRF